MTPEDIKKDSGKNSDRDLYRQFFQRALTIRMVENEIVRLYPSDKIQSPVHLSNGQEAVAVSFCATLQPDDMVFGTYRSHAFYLAMGGDLKAMFSELYGKLSGGCKGKAGSMHLAAPEVGFMGSTAVVASNFPHAVGAALAAKVKGTNQVAVAVFGDGATEEGVAHESLNFAALHNLPVIFLCENNGLAVHSHRKDRQSYSLCEWAGSYMKTLRITDSWDMINTYSVLQNAVNQVRKSSRPLFIEIETYRYKEHVGPGDDYYAGYRSESDLKYWTDRDCLIQDTKLLNELEPIIAEKIADAVAFAEADAYPGREELLKDVM